MGWVGRARPAKTGSKQLHLSWKQLSLLLARASIKTVPDVLRKNTILCKPTAEQNQQLTCGCSAFCLAGLQALFVPGCCTGCGRLFVAVFFSRSACPETCVANKCPQNLNNVGPLVNSSEKMVCCTMLQNCVSNADPMQVKLRLCSFRK